MLGISDEGDSDACSSFRPCNSVEETDRKQEGKKDAGVETQRRQRAWRARVKGDEGGAGLLDQLLRAGFPRCHWSADPR